MYAVTALIGLLCPILSGTWIGKLAGRSIGGFFLGWVSTPIMAVLAMLLLFSTIQAPFATIVAVESPIVGLGTGLISGGFSAFFVRQRLATSESRTIGELAKELVVSNSQEQ